MNERAAEAWNEVGSIPGVARLPFPWPVASAERLGLHASLRRFYRLIPQHAAKREPPTVVLVLYENDDAEAVARYQRAAHWFQAAGVRVPQVYGASSRALIVEDGGDVLLADAVDSVAVRDYYEQAARVVLALQSHGRAHPSPNPDLRLDRQRLRRELAFTEEHALHGWLECGPCARRQRAFDRLAAAVGEQPRRMCHRDFHSRNLLIDDDLMVLDFQDVMSGPLFYDVASLLHDDYRDVPAAMAARTLEIFRSAVPDSLSVAATAEVPAEPGSLSPAARQSLALAGAQRSLKALGTFGYQISVAGRRQYARFARRTWRHARRSLSGLGWHDLIEDLAVFDRL